MTVPVLSLIPGEQGKGPPGSRAESSRPSTVIRLLVIEKKGKRGEGIASLADDERREKKLKTTTSKRIFRDWLRTGKNVGGGVMVSAIKVL